MRVMVNGAPGIGPFGPGIGPFGPGIGPKGSSMFWGSIWIITFFINN
jgi:hypothetical protein